MFLPLSNWRTPHSISLQPALICVITNATRKYASPCDAVKTGSWIQNIPTDGSATFDTSTNCPYTCQSQSITLCDLPHARPISRPTAPAAPAAPAATGAARHCIYYIFKVSASAFFTATLLIRFIRTGELAIDVHVSCYVMHGRANYPPDAVAACASDAFSSVSVRV